jgi:integrase
MLNAAVDDDVIKTNPARKLGKKLHLVAPKTHRQEKIKAFTREQRDSFLVKAWELERRLAPLWFVQTRTGVRPGEAYALQWDDLDLVKGEARIERTLSDDGRRVDTPKSNHGRDVDLSDQCVAVLRRLEVGRKAETLRRGWREAPSWVFCSTTGGLLDAHNVRRAFRRVLKAAGLPLHFTPHCLRHTYASLLLTAGVSMYYVQRQLGHASIQLTCDTYGKWLPPGNRAAVNLLDSSEAIPAGVTAVVTPPLPAEVAVGVDPGSSGHSLVTPDDVATDDDAQNVDLSSGPPEIRTPDPLIKRKLVPCHHSTAFARYVTW